MTIQEAIEANKTRRVRQTNGNFATGWYEVGELEKPNPPNIATFTKHQIFGEWEAEPEKCVIERTKLKRDSPFSLPFIEWCYPLETNQMDAFLNKPVRITIEVIE